MLDKVLDKLFSKGGLMVTFLIIVAIVFCLNGYTDLVINWWNAGVIVAGSLTTWFCKNKYKETKSRPLLNCLPGVWTSLGLLGTFLSLCVTLHNVPRQNSNDTEKETANTQTTGKPNSQDKNSQTQAETTIVTSSQNKEFDINNVIDGLAPAFTTSIIGLIGALIISVYTKEIFAKEDTKEDKKLGLSPEEYLKITSDNIYQLLVQSNVFHTNMSGNIKNMSDKIDALLNTSQRQLNFSIEQEEANRKNNEKLSNNITEQSKILKQFIDGFVKRMDEFFQQMHEAIQQQVLAFGDEQFSKTSELLTSISKELSKVSRELISNQQESVKAMMNETNTGIGNIGARLSEALENLTTQIKGSLSSMNSQQQEQLNGILKNYGQMAQKLTEQMHTGYTEVQEHNVKSLEQMVELRDAYQELTEKLVNTLNTRQSEGIETITAKYDKLLANLSTQIEKFTNGMTAQIQSGYNNVQEQNGQNIQQMVNMRDTLVKTMQEVLTKATDMNGEATSNLRKSMDGFVNDMSQIVRDQCTDLNSAIAQNVESLKKAYEFIEGHVAEIKQNYDQTAIAFENAVSVAHRTNEASGKAIEENNKSLKAIEDTNSKIAEVLDMLTTRQDNIEQLTKQISSVSAAIEELQKLESALNRITSK